MKWIHTDPDPDPTKWNGSIRIRIQSGSTTLLVSPNCFSLFRIWIWSDPGILTGWGPYLAVGQLNENPVHKYELLIFIIVENELLDFITVENEQLDFIIIEYEQLVFDIVKYEQFILNYNKYEHFS